MTIRYDQRATLARAKDLLATNREEDLRYACLELRMCIETICYEKLKLYQKQVPQELLETWQPKKVIESLLEYEPYIEENLRLSICEEDKNGNPIGKFRRLGEHKAIKIKFIKETYHRLGNFLHIPTIAQQKSQKQENLRDNLIDIVSKLEELCSSTIDSNIASVITFECQYCNNTILRNKNSLEKNKFLICPECRAEYEFYYNEETPMFQAQEMSYTCPHCQIEYFIRKHLLKEGSILSCDKCSSKFILERKWLLNNVEG
jgi:predicted RNA-binding Zn-ribbon protein involved in translation (DUF1610 family)